RTVRADGNEATAGLEHRARVLDMTDIRCIDERRVHQDYVEFSQLRATSKKIIIHDDQPRAAITTQPIGQQLIYLHRYNPGGAFARLANKNPGARARL